MCFQISLQSAQECLSPSHILSIVTFFSLNLLVCNFCQYFCLWVWIAFILWSFVVLLRLSLLAIYSLVLFILFLICMKSFFIGFTNLCHKISGVFFLFFFFFNFQPHLCFLLLFVFSVFCLFLFFCFPILFKKFLKFLFEQNFLYRSYVISLQLSNWKVFPTSKLLKYSSVIF